MRATAIGAAVVLALATSPAAATESGGGPPVAVMPPPLTAEAFRQHTAEKVALGRLLFFDKILSGNQNIACASCHDPDSASADGMSLGVGEGGEGLGAARKTRSAGDAVRHRVPRNAPALFNLGAKSVTSLLWDGRIALDPAARAKFGAPFDTPAQDALPPGLDSVVAAQALFPMISPIEMAGEPNENLVALAASRDERLAWEEIAARLRVNAAYADLFAGAYDHIDQPADIAIADAANAIAAFVETQWRADQSPFDRWRRGEETAISDQAKRGARLFYGAAGCADCHAGALQTDQQFHAIAMPQIGPGKYARMTAQSSDFGRMAVTGLRRDAYKFRTPSLRNVAVTSPYGHAGAYASLEAVVRHHLDPVAAFDAYDLSMAALPDDPSLNARDAAPLSDRRERAAIRRANGLAPRPMADGDVAAVLAFLRTLTDEASLTGRFSPPSEVPSGLPLD